jgi:hypothetical protein
LITALVPLPAGRAVVVRPAFFHRIPPGPQLRCNFSRGAVFLETTSIIIMKTLLSILSILTLIIAAMSLDTYQLDVGDWFTAAMVAVIFGFALNDTQRAPRSFLRLR